MKFKVGDRVRVVRVLNRRINGHVIGSIGVVTGCGYQWRVPGDKNDGLWYVRLDITQAGCPGIFEACLELVPPDREQTIPWSQCVWKPLEIRA